MVLQTTFHVRRGHRTQAGIKIDLRPRHLQYFGGTRCRQNGELQRLGGHSTSGRKIGIESRHLTSRHRVMVRHRHPPDLGKGMVPQCVHPLLAMRRYSSARFLAWFSVTTSAPPNPKSVLSGAPLRFFCPSTVIRTIQRRAPDGSTTR